MNETAYKRKLRALSPYWSESYEPGKGSGVGYPDLQFLVGDRLWPVELKVGKVVGHLIKPTCVRPSQVAWFHGFLSAGGKADLAVCFGPLENMNCVLLPDCRREALVKWRDGYDIRLCRWLVREGEWSLGT